MIHQVLKMNSLNEMQDGIIKEIGNIGAGHIVMYLSQITKAKTELDISRVYELDNKQLGNISKYLTSKIYAIDYRFDPAPAGGFLLLFPKEAPQNVLIFLRSASATSLNNLTTAYSKSLEDYIGIKCKITLKKRYEETESTILSEVFDSSFTGKDKLLLIDTRYNIESTPMDGHMFLYFDSKEYGNITNAINAKIKGMIG